MFQGNQKQEEFERLLHDKVRVGLSAFADVLSKDELQKAEDSLFKKHYYIINQWNEGTFKPDSTLFDYSSKIQAVVDHFAADDLTRTDYLKAAAKQAQLFTQSPQTIINNIEGVTDHFAKDGLTRTDYFKAAVKQGQIFTQSPQTIISNIEGVTDHFATDGLSRTDYLKAAAKQAQIFCQSPQTIISNIEDVTDHFAKDGLSRADYLKAATKQAQIFCQSPQTIISNIEGVTDHFATDGLSRTDYLKAAAKQESLFVRSPQTIIRHVQFMQTMVDLDLLPKGNVQKPYIRLFDNLTKTPMRFCLGDDNFILRLDYGVRQAQTQKSFKLLSQSRSSLEEEYEKLYGPFDVNRMDTGLVDVLEQRKLWPLPQKKLI
jgi:molecular chaperone GrpE (heat shock protein)